MRRSWIFAAVVGMFSVTPAMGANRVRWLSANGLEPLSGIAINADGTVAVGDLRWTAVGGSSTYIWRSGAGLSPVATPSGMRSVTLQDISGDGRVSVGFANKPIGVVAVRSVNGGPVIEMSTPSAGPVTLAANHDGSVIAGRIDLVAYRWTTASGWQTLGLPAVDENRSVGITADGNSIFASAPGGIFRWSVQAPATRIYSSTQWITNVSCSPDGRYVVGFLPGERKTVFLGSHGVTTLNFMATAVSDTGIVVGVDAPTQNDAQIYHASFGQKSLIDFAAELGTTGLTAGSVFRIASDISADGNTIFGTGARGAGNLPFALRIPEPTVLLLGAAGLVTVSRRARRTMHRN